MSGALFTIDGDGYMPTDLAIGPWDPNTLHGGASASLMAGAIEDLEPGAELFVARMTVELLRPVPKDRLDVSVSLLRPGKKVQLVGASISAGGTEVARATGLRIRQVPLEIPEYPRPQLEMPAFPAESDPMFQRLSPGAGMGSAMEFRYAAGHFAVPGPATAWLRLLCPVVEGHEPTALQRVMAAADFGNGLSGVLDYGRYVYINPDLTVYLHRSLQGEWVCLDAVTEAGDDGVGVAESRLWDQNGHIGRSIQSLLIDQRLT
ncbi:MAG: thioesterase family protein [Candidatus Dormibacteraeota bacterium]|nr:thioesterase family protein [Candidatus Dormibacteraeota bacterium]